MKYATLAISAVLCISATAALGATVVSPADQRSWTSSTASTGLDNQIDLQWGSTELIVNGGFEADTWYNASRSTDYAYAGQYRLRVPQQSSTSQIVTVEANATFTATAFGQRIWPALPRLLLTSYDELGSSGSAYLSDNDEPNWGSQSLDFITGPTNTTARLWLYNQTDSNDAFFDEVSMKPKNLYVYRSDAPFTSTAGIDLIATLNGLTAEGYSDMGVSGDFWYAVTASSSASTVTSFQGNAIPEPASLGLVATVGTLLLARRRA